MAPQRKGPTLSAGEDALIAVLLADSFTQRFRPITLERPKVLLPLVGVPLLDYTLEWLASNDVAEVYVFCSAHAEQVKQHLEGAGWLQERSSFHVKVIVSTNCKSAGEALREIDVKDVIKTDFVLVSGDVVSNMDLGAAMRAHRARRDKDKGAIMTMVMKAGVDAAQRRRMGENGLVVAMDPATQRLLRHEEVDLGRVVPVQAVIDAHFWGEADAVEVRADLADTQIYLCAPEVLMLFSDNFDYQNVRRDFVAGVLSEEELGQTLHCHLLAREYAACASTLRAYDAISRDVLQRWTFPFVPDTNLLPLDGAWGPSSFRLARSFIYKEKSVHVARTAVVGHDTCIGAGTVLEEACQVEASVVGRDCRIGVGACVSGSYLLDGVTVGAGAHVADSLLCDGAAVAAGAVLRPGCILSFKVAVGQEQALEARTCLSMCRQAPQTASLSDDELEYAAGAASPPSASDSLNGSPANGASGRQQQQQKQSGHLTALPEGAEGRDGIRGADGEEFDVDVVGPDGEEFDVDVVGPDGRGYCWHAPETAADNAPADAARFSLAPPPPLPPPPAGDFPDDDSMAAAGEDGADAAPADPEASFKQEVAETFLRCVADGYDPDLAVIELNGLKIAEHRDFADCARYILTSVLGLCMPAPARVRAEYRSQFPDTAPDVATPTGRTELLTRLQRLLRAWGPMLRKFLRSHDDQVDLLLTLEEFCGEEGVFEGAGERGAAFATVFPKVLQLLYDGDVIEEDAFFKWAEEKAHADEEDRLFLTKAAEFITWLKEAEEEEEEGSEEEEEDDDDS